jgi:hypothetical protein
MCKFPEVAECLPLHKFQQLIIREVFADSEQAIRF